MTPPGTGVVGVGVDAVEVDRFRRLLGRRPGLATRLFTDGERAEAARRGDGAERLAARFAAKEATMKALGAGIGALRWQDVEVVAASGGPGGAALPLSRQGAPALRLRAGAAELAAARGVARWHVSLTHTSAVAIAMVVGEATAGAARTR